MAKPPGRSGKGPGAKRASGGGGRDRSGAVGKGGSGRQLTTRVKTARGRKTSSQRWLQRQLNDPYVAAAQAEGYRSRAAWKLVEMDDRFHMLRPGARVLDLGAAPGGWTQVAVARCGRRAKVLAVDINEMDAVPGAGFLQVDMRSPEAPGLVRTALDGPADVVLSDMAPPAMGHRQTDHLRIMALCEAALDLACAVLVPGGTFVCKVLQGGAEDSLLQRMKTDFRQVRHAKPPASRADSSEAYVVAQGFRGGTESGGGQDGGGAAGDAPPDSDDGDPPQGAGGGGP